MDIFEFQNPVYYLKDRLDPLNTPVGLAVLETQLDEMIAESVSSGNVVTKTLKVAAQVGVPGQILGEVLEIVVEADGNTVQFKDNGSFVLEQLAEAGQIYILLGIANIRENAMTLSAANDNTIIDNKERTAA